MRIHLIFDFYSWRQEKNAVQNIFLHLYVDPYLQIIVLLFPWDRFPGVEILRLWDHLSLKRENIREGRQGMHVVQAPSSELLMLGHFQ